MQTIRVILVCVAIWATTAFAAVAADRDKIEAFMEVTGFDVSLESMKASAVNAPAMLGLDAADFGMSWLRLADELFEPKQLKTDAIDILERTLDEDVLAHASAFYASDFGQRLVTAENESHWADATMKREKGEDLVAELMNRGSPQPQYFLDMSDAIGSIDTGIRQFREVQVRFILAAMASGIIENQMSEDGLRAVLGQQDAEIRGEVLNNMIALNAYTYRDFSDDDIMNYRDALQTPEMQEVYELMNALQYTLMADRYEKIAGRMRELHPTQEL